MNTYTRRRFLQTVSAATLAAAGGLPDAVRAQVVTLRCSSSMPADQNAAHYVWYERLAANLKASVGDAIRSTTFRTASSARKAMSCSRSRSARST